MRDMFPTRGYQAIGGNITPKQLGARTKRNLAYLRQKTEGLALPWSDVDNSVEGALSELMVAFDKFEQHINESVEWLNEPAPF